MAFLRIDFERNKSSAIATLVWHQAFTGQRNKLLRSKYAHVAAMRNKSPAFLCYAGVAGLRNISLRSMLHSDKYARVSGMRSMFRRPILLRSKIRTNSNLVRIKRLVAHVWQGCGCDTDRNIAA